MARITATNNVQVALEDDQPYVGTLSHIDVEAAHNLPDGKLVGPQLVVDWELEDSSSVRDWIGFSIGINNKGVPSKLRQLCNALSDRPPLDEIGFFDDETYEWGYQGAEGPADNRLSEGMQVTFVGTTKARKAGGTRYGIDKYKQTKRQKPITKPKVLKPARDDFEPDDSDDIPF